MTDATCYESYIRYPTDSKLLWESIARLYPKMCFLYKSLGVRKPRTKYDKQEKRYRRYSKKRRHGIVETRVLRRSLLHLLNKLVVLTKDVIKQGRKQLKLNPSFYKRYSVICWVLTQQQAIFEGEKVADRIVSIDKSYIHPIVRGKETKGVEFGAKVNTIQIDGINFIEHLSFSAFHEGNHLPQCVTKHQKLFRRKSLIAGSRCTVCNQCQSQVL